MEINATLLVQVCNFIVAYVIMDRLFLRLAANIIQTEDRKLGSVESEVAEVEKRISSRIRYNEDDWLILQKRLQSECPHVSVGQHTKAPYEHCPLPPLFSQADITSATERFKKKLVTSILDSKDKHG